MIDALIGLLPSLGEFLRDAVSRRRLRDERGQRAVAAILTALNETNIYLASVSRRGNRSPAKEEKLSQVWVAAAASLHGLDDDLASRCYLKGKYWANPDSWSDRQLMQTGIRLARMTADAQKLLGWKPMRRGAKAAAVARTRRTRLQ